MIRNYSWTGNPLYPLFNSFPGISSDADVLRDLAYKESWWHMAGSLGHFNIRKILFGEPWWQTLLVPVNIFFLGKDGSPQYFDGVLNPFLFFLPVFAFINQKGAEEKDRAGKKIMFFFSILFIIFAFLKTSMRIRYLAPVMPPLVILSIFGIHEIVKYINERYSGTSRKICIAAVTVLILSALSYNGLYAAGQFKKIDPLSYLSGKKSRGEYIAGYRPEYSSMEYINGTLPEDSRLLCLFLGNNSYYCDREMFFGVNFFKETLKNTSSPEEMAAELQKIKVTHLYVGYKMLSIWINDNFNNMEKMRLELFFSRQTELLFAEKGYGVFRFTDRR